MYVDIEFCYTLATVVLIKHEPKIDQISNNLRNHLVTNEHFLNGCISVICCGKNKTTGKPGGFEPASKSVISHLFFRL